MLWRMHPLWMGYCCVLWCYWSLTLVSIYTSPPLHYMTLGFCNCVSAGSGTRFPDVCWTSFPYLASGWVSQWLWGDILERNSIFCLPPCSTHVSHICTLRWFVHVSYYCLLCKSFYTWCQCSCIRFVYLLSGAECIYSKRSSVSKCWSVHQTSEQCSVLHCMVDECFQVLSVSDGSLGRN